MVVEADLEWAGSPGCFEEAHIASCIHFCVTLGLTRHSEIVSTAWSEPGKGLGRGGDS